jgi:hypothetical protein
VDNLIPNAKDVNFKSLLAKLKAADWLEGWTDTPATATAKRNFNFSWSLKGQLCAMTIKKQMKDSPYWNETNAFLASLNEQEEAFYHAIFLASVPDGL